MNELRDHKKWQNSNKLTLNDIYMHDLNLVFFCINGNYLPNTTLFNAFKRILKQAELQQLPIHSLRHTHAVMLIQDRLGHRSMALRQMCIRMSAIVLAKKPLKSMRSMFHCS
ncbi:hypothetical protein [Domibacillus aminovorans]|uniref:Tyr recombinase domain-containing protein n=1 Tax=Domibacillus aminovorans TaxID=29332 RepID=A0A177L560_9BACI|nr:hypothetical protein AWH49_16630 [Domibacillus aminovorans]